MRRVTNQGALLLEIEPICEEFECALRDGSNVRIEAYLESRVGVERKVLLRELLALELHYDSQRGATASIDSYRDRFPDDKDSVVEAWTAWSGAGGGPQAAPMGSMAPGSRFGNYTILGEVGRGGMGVVYRASHGALDRIVALKVLPEVTAGHTSAQERFEREARAIARLHHGNIVPVFEVGSVDGAPYYAMQLIEGHALDEIIQGQKSPTAGPGGPKSSRAPLAAEHRSLAAQMADVADALHYAHELGVVHRDIKPSNIIIDGRDVAWIVDFGVARVEGSNLTGQEDLLGTIRYMPPERFIGIGDEQGDVYSLGVTLFEAIAGRPAYGEQSPSELMRAIEGRDVPRLRKFIPDVSLDLETIIAVAAAREPSGRYPSALALAEDLRKFASGQPIAARRPAWPERLQRWVRRNPAAAAAAAALVLLTVVSVTASLVFRTKNADITRLSQNVGELLQRSESARLDLRGTLYRSDMLRGSQEAFLRGGASKLARLLTPWSTPADDPDVRGWEWYLLRSIIGGDDGVLWDTDFAGSTVDVNGAGDLLAAGARSGVRIWDLETRKQVSTLGTGSHPTCARFSPSGREVVASGIGSVRVFDAITGERLASCEGAVGGRVSWHPDGERVALFKDGLRYWSFATGGLGPVLRSDASPTFVDVSPSGAMLLFMLDTRAICVADAGTGETMSVFRGPDFTGAGEFDPSGTRFVTADRSDRIHVWDITTSKLLLTIPAAHASTINRVRWSPDGTQLISCAYDASVKIWDADTGSLARTFLGHEGDVLEATFDGTQAGAISTSRGGDIRFWEVGRPPGYRQMLPFGIKHRIKQLDLSWHPSDGTLAVSSPMASALCRTEESSPTWEVTEGTCYPHWSPDGRFLQSTVDGKPSIKDTLSGRELLTDDLRDSIQIPKSHERPQDWSWSPDGAQLYARGDMAIYVISGFPDHLSVKSTPCARAPVTLEMSSDGRHFAVPFWTGVELIDVETGQVSEAIDPEHFAVTGHDYPVPFMDPTGRSLAVAQGSRLLILGFPDLTCTSVFQEHTGKIYHASWSPDGARIATCSEDKTVRVVDPSAGEVLTLACPMALMRVSWSPGGDQLAAVDTHGVVHLWDASFALAGEKDGTLRTAQFLGEALKR